MQKNFEFPQSAQSDLFAMLTPKQRVETANVFRHIKKASQVELSYALMDFIEDAVIPDFAPEDLILATAFVTLTHYNMPEKAPWSITPYQVEGSKLSVEGTPSTFTPHPSTNRPRRLGNIINDIFPMFNTPKK